jgi:hypothetical protein
VWKIERDFFGPAREYPLELQDNGIPLRDMLWPDLDLSDASFGGCRRIGRVGDV